MINKEKKTIKIPGSFEEINKNPIYKPASEYVKGSELFEQEDERESEELKNALAKLNESIDEDIITESIIAQLYENIKRIYDRMLWIYSKNVKLANDKIREMIEMVNKYYVTRETYNEDIMELENKNKRDLEKLRKQKDEEIEEVKKEKAKSQQIKKENSDSSNENYLDTRSKAGEDKTIEQMPVSVDNQSADDSENEEDDLSEKEDEENNEKEEDDFKDFETKFEEELAA